jgi:hypothetical protein
MPAHDSSQAHARHAADLRADKLDRPHERIGQQLRPARAVTVLRSCLGLSGDAGGIVIGGARDQAWSKNIAPVPSAPRFACCGSRQRLGRTTALTIEETWPRL